MKNFKLTQLDMNLTVSAPIGVRQAFCVSEKFSGSAK